MPDPEATRWLEWFATLLAETSLRAALIGGQARNFWAEPRATVDYDFTVAADAEAVAQVIARLQQIGYEIAREQGAKLPSGPDFVQLVHPVTKDRVEFQTAKTEYQDLVLRRALPSGDKQLLSVATPEDLIVMKLLASRRKDQIDLVDLGSLPDLDWPYIERWAHEWQVTDRLAELRERLAAEEQRIRDLYA